MRQGEARQSLVTHSKKIGLWGPLPTLAVCSPQCQNRRSVMSSAILDTIVRRAWGNLGRDGRGCGGDLPRVGARGARPGELRLAARHWVEIQAIQNKQKIKINKQTKEEAGRKREQSKHNVNRTQMADDFLFFSFFSSSFLIYFYFSSTFRKHISFFFSKTPLGPARRTSS